MYIDFSINGREGVFKDFIHQGHGENGPTRKSNVGWLVSCKSQFMGKVAHRMAVSSLSRNCKCDD